MADERQGELKTRSKGREMTGWLGVGGRGRETHAGRVRVRWERQKVIGVRSRVLEGPHKWGRGWWHYLGRWVSG